MGKQHLSRIAAKHINVMDAVNPAPHTPVPGFTVIRVEAVESFTREKTRDTGAFWDEFNDLTLGDLAGSPFALDASK